MVLKFIGVMVFPLLLVSSGMVMKSGGPDGASGLEFGIALFGGVGMLLVGLAMFANSGRFGREGAIYLTLINIGLIAVLRRFVLAVLIALVQALTATAEGASSVVVDLFSVAGVLTILAATTLLFSKVLFPRREE